jgi:hypothetical protein
VSAVSFSFSTGEFCAPISCLLPQFAPRSFSFFPFFFLFSPPLDFRLPFQISRPPDLLFSADMHPLLAKKKSNRITACGS